MPSTPEHQQHHETTDQSDELTYYRERVHQLEAQLTAIRAIVDLDADEFKRDDQ